MSLWAETQTDVNTGRSAPTPRSDPGGLNGSEEGTEGCVGMEGSSFLPSAALFHYRQPAMNYTEPVNTSIIKHMGGEG